MKFCAAILAAVVVFVSSGSAFAQGRQNSQGREFLMSCTYGVLAGTLVGAASLAFTDKPSENLNHVARGASIGLYTGILLGIYVVYVVPAMESEPEEDPIVRMPLIIEPTLNAQANPDGAKIGWQFLF
jgi:hypothetical protein